MRSKINADKNDRQLLQGWQKRYVTSTLMGSKIHLVIHELLSKARHET